MTTAASTFIARDIAAPASIALGGRAFKLAFPIKAVILYKQKTGDNLFLVDTWKRINPEEDPDRFISCLWAGLQTHHPELTLDEVSTMVDFSNVVETLRAITGTLVAYMPKAEEPDPNAKAPAPQLAAVPSAMDQPDGHAAD